MRVLEIVATSVGLALFCSLSFAGLHRMNARLEASGLQFVQPEIWLDRLVPLSEVWIWPYLSYYLLCFLPIFLLRRIGSFRRVALAYFIEFGLAFVFFAAFPMRMEQPPVLGSGASAEALRWLYRVDRGYNIFPSLHVANAFLVAFAFLRTHRRFGIWLTGYAFVISLSTLFVKQHYVADVFAGVALAVLADRLAFRGWSIEIEREALERAADRARNAPRQAPGTPERAGVPVGSTALR